MHAKISDEYVINKKLIKEKLSFFLSIFKCLWGIRKYKKYASSIYHM